MSLEELKNFIKDTCLAHKDVNSFSMGNNYNIAESGYDKYPHTFLELPYLINYDYNTKRDSIQFGLNVFLYSKVDDIVEDHYAISMAKNIGDSIIYKMMENNDITFTNIVAISLKEFSDDNVAGIRYEITIITKNSSYCDYENSFN